MAAQRNCKDHVGLKIGDIRIVPLFGSGAQTWRNRMLGTILLVLLILMLLGAVPAWPYSRGWGYAPSGIVVVLLIVLVIALSTGHI